MSRLGLARVAIDATEIGKLQKALREVDLRKQDQIMVRALNRGMDRLHTETYRFLKDETGIKKPSLIRKGMAKNPASSGRWTAAVIIRSNYTRITPELYSARWRRSWAGAKHRLWKQENTAEHTFMIPSRKGIYVRYGKARPSIRPIWGPNMVRVIERHAHVVEATAEVIVQATVVPEVRRLINLEVGRVKGKYGL